MAGNALPLAKVEDPGIGEAADVIVGLTVIGALRVIDPGDHCGIAEEIHFDVLNVGQGRFEKRVFDVGKKSLLIAEFAIPLGVDEAAGNQRVEGRGVPVHLGFVPQPFQHEKFAFPRIGVLRGGYLDRG